MAAAAAGATSAAPSCDERSRGAIADVLGVVATSRACAVDADCVIVSVGASCFDVCSRGVSASGATAVRDAEKRINRTTCANYKQDGCSFSVPPCMPPGKATCNAGLCE